MKLAQVLKKPMVTEKSTQEMAMGKYAFEVDQKANKKEIARAVSEYFGVKVKKVWTKNYFDKGQRKKRALVLLAEGEKINLFESGD